MTGVDDLHAAWAKCHPNCKSLLLGDLNFDFWAPQTNRGEIITDFISEINLKDVSHKYVQQCGRQQGRGAQWTWQQQRGGALAPIPARLLHGKGIGWEVFLQCGIPAAQDP
jgi:hypothetical protein